MKILQIIPYFVPAYSYGGPLKNCYYLSKELVRMGHNVTVATTDTLDDSNRIKEKEEIIDGIKVVRFKNISNTFAKNFNAYTPIGFYGWIKKNISNYDIVHCHDFFTYQNIITSRVCNKTGTPFIVQPRGVIFDEHIQSRFSLLKKFLLFFIKKNLKNHATLVATSETEKEKIENFFPFLKNKTPIIYNGINLDDFANIQKIDLYKKFSIKKNVRLIGFLGRIQHIKGLDISLEILSLLKKEIDFIFIIIGPNEQGEKEKLIQKATSLGIDKNIIFTGILTGKEKLETIKSCDIFLFTSRAEGTPITAIEVAALGIPQIISDTCPISNIIATNGGGFKFKLNQKKEMAEKILTILGDLKSSKNIGLMAKKLVEENLDLKIVIRKFDALYKRLVSEKNK